MMLARIASRWLTILFVCSAAGFTPAQTAYFSDGYHGGIYGHYPPTFTQFIVDSLRSHPDWNINLEIEPETWDFVRTNTPDAYKEFKELAVDQSAGGRIEFVNPAYGQGYLWNISGESVIQQLDRGMSKIREHFPNAAFTTYSSEEPCFTSALPEILKSFGFKYAVLKNPNTCWGGYTRAFGGELVNWIGPDGTAIPTVPRYEIEFLKPGSTWETIACANSPDYIRAATAARIEHPVGMCLQDAGWRFGPWLDHVGNYYQPTKSTLWRNYFENVATQKPAQDWRFSQEDVQVSLVWGAQVLQRIAQQVRHAENRIVMAEKMATLASVYQNVPWPGEALDEGWRTLMLAQHHDCWIVPYNGRGTNTWADKVARWTDATCRLSDEVLEQSMSVSVPAQTNGGGHFIRVFNTLGTARTELAEVTLSDGWQGDAVKISSMAGKEISVQSVKDDKGGQRIIFPTSVPALGFSTYRLAKIAGGSLANLIATAETNGLFTFETDLYKLVLDSKVGGTIRSLIAKKLAGRELVETANTRRFNEIRGYFFERGKYFSTADQPAKIEILENGPVRIRVRVSSEIESNAVTQTITLVQGEPRIDFSVRIDWRGSPGIGNDFGQSGNFQREQDHKALYDDHYKLLALFPLNLPQQKIFKDAPFDVTESRLTNTFFENWSAIKNDVILNWVEAFDEKQDIGVTLLTDHTTSYAHGLDHPLGLTLQYSGVGLWGRGYSLKGPTEVRYALLPHAGDWQQADVWTKTKSWNEPLVAKLFQSDDAPVEPDQSLLQIEGNDWEIPTARVTNGKILVRLFNPSANVGERTIHYSGAIAKVELVQLDGQVVRELAIQKQTTGDAVFKLALPQFGIGTLRITPAGTGQTLREAAGKRLLVGCAAATVDLQDPKLAALIAEQFNCITPEYEFMPEHMVDDKGTFTFARGDAVVAFAEKHQMPVFGHMLVWHFVTRKWLFESPDGKPLPREEALANLKKYIDGVMGHYKGRVHAWDVVNEALNDKNGEYLKDTPARRAIGDDYIEKAFEFAHAADPGAELYYNDYNIEQPEKLAKTLRLVSSLKAKGARLDAVGIQGHWLINWPPPDMIEHGIEAIAAQGIKVMITEFDVDPLPRENSGADMTVAEKGASPYPDGLPPEMQEKLARRYGEIVTAVVRHPAVTMLGFWGTHDGRSWLNDFPVKGRTNYPLLFDRRYHPKPAFDAVLKALKTENQVSHRNQ
jgi:alpha-mannosidase